MTDAVFSDEKLYESAVNPIPMGRPGTAADLAGATLLLATDASDALAVPHEGLHRKSLA